MRPCMRTGIGSLSAPPIFAAEPHWLRLAARQLRSPRAPSFGLRLEIPTLECDPRLEKPIREKTNSSSHHPPVSPNPEEVNLTGASSKRSLFAAKARSDNFLFLTPRCISPLMERRSFDGPIFSTQKRSQKPPPSSFSFFLVKDIRSLSDS